VRSASGGGLIGDERIQQQPCLGRVYLAAALSVRGDLAAPWSWRIREWRPCGRKMVKSGGRRGLRIRREGDGEDVRADGYCPWTA
jgi:hypothetical protein